MFKKYLSLILNTISTFFLLLITITIGHDLFDTTLKIIGICILFIAQILSWIFQKKNKYVFALLLSVVILIALFAFIAYAMYLDNLYAHLI